MAMLVWGGRVGVLAVSAGHEYMGSVIVSSADEVIEVSVVLGMRRLWSM